MYNVVDEALEITSANIILLPKYIITITIPFESKYCVTVNGQFGYEVLSEAIRFGLV